MTHDSDDVQSQCNGQGHEDGPPRKRARLSCNACKARKTKCVGFDNGTCEHCRSVGIPCEADLRGRKRPFYRVSGEVYEYSIKLLRRFVPEDQLPELTVENIQSLLERLEAGNAPSPLALPDTTSNVVASPAQAPGDGDRAKSSEVMEPDEHPLLQEELGCMLLDSMGKYRYVGADSSIRWNHAVRMTWEPSRAARSDFNIISPLKTGLLPPTTPESPNSANRRGEMYFPPRQLCMAYASRFFDQVHCMYWFFSSEQFYTRLDQALEDRGTTASSSWLCALYSVFAMGSMRPSDGASNGIALQDTKTALEYLSMARELSTSAADEADIDSIKAFGLLSLATHATCYSVTAYLHLGTAVRIGFSLGLHRNVSPRSKDSLEREWGRRLWWTIYILDHEMASRFGYPCSIMDDAVFMRTPPATEQVLDPGPNTPLGYQALLVQLVQLRKRISHDCFLSPAQVGGRLPISRVTSCLSALRRWAADIPAHLRADASLHPQHRRAVYLLHLRYWGSVILLTRPFLLFALSRTTTSPSTSTTDATPSTSTLPTKRHLYESLSIACISASESAVQVIQRMRDTKCLSSLMLLDCQGIGEVMWILILALQKHGGMERQGMLRGCLDTLRGMERIGWCEKVTPEFEARVRESGVLMDGERGVVGGTSGGEVVVGGVGQGVVMQRQEQPEQQQQQQTGLELMGGGHFMQAGTIGGDVALMGGLGGTPGVQAQMLGGQNQWEYPNSDLDGLKFDVFETMDFGNGGRLERTDMDMFMDASFSGSQFLFDHLDGVHPP